MKWAAVEAVPYMKKQLVESQRQRVAGIENGDHMVVGVNAYKETEDSPLSAGEKSIQKVDRYGKRTPLPS